MLRAEPKKRRKLSTCALEGVVGIGGDAKNNMILRYFATFFKGTSSLLGPSLCLVVFTRAAPQGKSITEHPHHTHVQKHNFEDFRMWGLCSC